MMLNGGTYNGRRILSRASVEAMTEVHTGELEMAPTAGRGSVMADKGLGWAVARRSQSFLSMRPVSIGSYGSFGGSGCFGWVDPEKDLVGIFLIARQVLDPVRPRTELDTFMAMAAAAIAD